MALLTGAVLMVVALVGFWVGSSHKRGRGAQFALCAMGAAAFATGTTLAIITRNDLDPSFIPLRLRAIGSFLDPIEILICLALIAVSLAVFAFPAPAEDKHRSKFWLCIPAAVMLTYGLLAFGIGHYAMQDAWVWESLGGLLFLSAVVVFTSLKGLVLTKLLVRGLLAVFLAAAGVYVFDPGAHMSVAIGFLVMAGFPFLWMGLDIISFHRAGSDMQARLADLEKADSAWTRQFASEMRETLAGSDASPGTERWMFTVRQVHLWWGYQGMMERLTDLTQSGDRDVIYHGTLIREELVDILDEPPPKGESKDWLPHDLIRPLQQEVNARWQSASRTGGLSDETT